MWLHKNIRQLDKLLLILATYEAPCQIKEVIGCAQDAGYKIKPSSNPSLTLSRSKGLAIKTPSGWEITESGLQHLRTLNAPVAGQVVQQIASDLRAELKNIKNDTTRAFVEEAIKCYEFKLYRSAVVMSWLSAVHVLHDYISKHKLVDFNNEAIRRDVKWKKAKTTDDIARMGEFDFLEVINAISVIGKNVKEELQGCLKRRNGCGHPNSLQIGANTVAHHFEILINNVFKKFI